jgi:hypothetical protein
MKLCAFCLRAAKMSGEHMWSAWIERLFADFTGRYSFKTLVSEGVTKHWKSGSINLKAHVVCEPCNNTWMSDIDAEAKMTMKDMIRCAAHVTLLRRGIASIATFAFKTAVVADHVRPDRRPFFSHSARKRFATTLEIPTGVQMWLAAFRGAHLLSGRYTMHYAKVRSGRFKGFELYIFTYVAGFLGLQVTGWRWASIAKRRRFTPVLAQDPAFGPVAVPFWPSDGTPVVWPPPAHFDDQSVEIFANRWGRLVERVTA